MAVSHECDHPREARSLPRVTSSVVDAGARAETVDAAVSAVAASGRPLFALDAGRIRELAPDVVVTQGLCEVCAVSEGDVRALAATMHPPPAVVTLGATTLGQVLDSIASLGAALGAADEAQELLAGLRSRMRRVHETLARDRAPRPRVAVIEWTDPVYVAGHWVPDMVRRAGGVDALATPGDHSRPHEVAEIRGAAPDIVVVAPCGYGVERAADEAERLMARPEWSWAGSLPWWAVDGNALTSRPGPRLCDGIETLARIFNAPLFSPLLSGRARPVSRR